jgi:hypothetical protein
LAKCGASNSIEANLKSNTKLAKHEIISILEKAVRNNFFDKKSNLYSCNRHLSKLIFKLKQCLEHQIFPECSLCMFSTDFSTTFFF